jgi:hypothetical protein
MPARPQTKVLLPCPLASLAPQLQPLVAGTVLEAPPPGSVVSASVQDYVPKQELPAGAAFVYILTKSRLAA